VIFILFLLCGLFADVLAPYGMNQISPRNPSAGAVMAYPFGTDNLGRDMLSRCLYGAHDFGDHRLLPPPRWQRHLIVIGKSSPVISAAQGRSHHAALRRMLMSFPDLIILLVVVSVLGPGLPQIIGTLGLAARHCRSAHTSVPVVSGAREHVCARGPIRSAASTSRILWRHILPTSCRPIIVLFTTRVGTVILAERACSFLGLGVPPPTPTGVACCRDRAALHVPGTLAGAGPGSLPKRSSSRHQRVSETRCAICSIAHARLQINQKIILGREVMSCSRTSLRIAAASIAASLAFGFPHGARFRSNRRSPAARWKSGRLRSHAFGAVVLIPRIGTGKHNQHTGAVYEQLFGRRYLPSQTARRQASVLCRCWLPSDAIKGELAEDLTWENRIRLPPRNQSAQRAWMFSDKPA